MKTEPNNFREKYPSPNLLYRNNLIRGVLKKLDLTDKDVLEIGCGLGTFLDSISNMQARFTGLEPDNYAASKAQENCQADNIEVFQGDISSATGQFDYVLLLDVLEHIEDDITALTKVNSLLKDDGLFILTVPANSALYGEKDVAFGHYRRYNKTEILSKLLECGFDVIDYYSWGSAILSRLNRMFTKKLKKADIDLNKQSLESSYGTPSSPLIKLLFPIYSRLFFLLHYQTPFLRTKFLNAHCLCVCQKIKTKTAPDSESLERK